MSRASRRIISATMLVFTLSLVFNFGAYATRKISGAEGSLEHPTTIQGIQTEIDPVKSPPTTETLSLATGILNDCNGSNQRWRDIAENTYTDAYQNTFNYTQSNATVTYGLLDSNFTGTFTATGLKPNFAYQLKLMGKPAEDPLSDQHLRDIGRSYDIALNQSVGYVIFDYVVTDENGSAYKQFSLANSYHVLWNVNQRTPQGQDSTPTQHTVQGNPDDSPHAYATSVGPADVGIYAQWEKGDSGNVKLPFGSYHVEFIITEESFHSPLGDPTGGYWSTVMGCGVDFTIDDSPPTLMKGMTINAWSAEAYNSTDFDQSITSLAGTGADWVTLTVFWFMNTSSATEIQPRLDLYTASDPSLTHAIQKAHGLGMKVALKPMVDVVDGTWRGVISPSNWTLWFQNYRNFTNYYADLALSNNIELFTVGTELRSSQSYELEWRHVISDVRTHFSGNITYAANWDSYGIYSRLPQYAIKFWDALDYVGVDAYFPLTNTFNPTIAQLVGAWSYSTASGWWGTGFNWTNELYLTYTNTGKKIIFTEIGYTSQNGTNTQPWTWNVSPTLDLQEQADCYQAALESFKDKTWFEGWFWWDWETNPNAGGLSDMDYTPQNKPAQSILNQYYTTRTVTFQAAGTGVPVTVNCTRATGNYTTASSLTIPVDTSNSMTIPNGSNVSFSYVSPVDGGSGTRYVWNSANASSPLTNVASDTTVIGQYATQYYFTVTSSQDSPTPASGWFDSGSNVTESVTTPVAGPPGTRYVCTGWSGSGSVPASGTASSLNFVINVPSNITWNWTTQYLLTVLTDPPGISPQPTRDPAGEASPTNGWWYNVSLSVTLTAQTITGYTFGYWDVDGSSYSRGVNPATVNINASQTATAHYTTNTHDIALTNLEFTKNIIGQDLELNFTVTVENQGDYNETFNLTVYANTNVIIAVANLTSLSGNSATLPFTWNTTGFAKGNYTISAHAWPVPGETDTVDNNCTGGWVYVSIIGDITGGTSNLMDFIPDGKVDMRDIGVVAKFFGQNVPPAPANCDLTGPTLGVPDGKIDMRDIGLVAKNFGKTDP